MSFARDDDHVAREDRPLHGRRSPPARQQGPVHVQAAEGRQREHLGRQDQPVGDDDQHVRCERGERVDGRWVVDAMTLDVTHQRGNDYVRDTVPDA